MLKTLPLIALFFASLSAIAQPDPAKARTKEAFTWADSLFRGNTFHFEIAEFDFSPDIREILLKFNNAIAVNKEWFETYTKQAAPGQPLPYHEKFGITPEEYGRIKNMDKIHPSLKVVDTQQITILHQDGKITFQGDGDGRILGYLEFHLGKHQLVFAGDTIPFAPGVNTTSATAYGLLDAYIWRLQKTDLSKGLRADQLTARVVEIDMGIRQPGNKPLLRIQYQDMENGISRANLDLSGYITP